MLLLVGMEETVGGDRGRGWLRQRKKDAKNGFFKTYVYPLHKAGFNGGRGKSAKKNLVLAATVGYLKVDYTPHLLSIDMSTRKNKGVGGASNVSIA